MIFSWNNNDKVAFNLKNYLEILPVMNLSNKRNLKIYKRSGIIENWVHICSEDNIIVDHKLHANLFFIFEREIISDIYDI